VKIGIIGIGHVGRNISRRLAKAGINVVEYDEQRDSDYPAAELSKCDFAIVSVGTPAQESGQAELGHVFNAVSRIPCDYVLLRSTVPPGTTDALEQTTGKALCFSPEYVGETAFLSNSWGMWAHDDSFQILGGHPETRQYFLNALTTIYGPGTRFHQTTAVEAEIIKYMENCYFATKLTFVNEFYELCQHLGADWHSVREGWLLDPRVERDHTAVLPNDRGFGGRCLPKDLDALLAFADNGDIRLPLLNAVRETNAEYRGMLAHSRPPS
jgi:UDPglucose 6-dehydrogenase